MAPDGIRTGWQTPLSLRNQSIQPEIGFPKDDKDSDSHSHHANRQSPKSRPLVASDGVTFDRALAHIGLRFPLTLGGHEALTEPHVRYAQVGGRLFCQQRLSPRWIVGTCQKEIQNAGPTWMVCSGPVCFCKLLPQYLFDTRDRKSGNFHVVASGRLNRRYLF